MVSFENFVKSMPPSLSELKVIPSFCFAFKIPDDVTATNTYSQEAFVNPITMIRIVPISKWKYPHYKPNYQNGS